MTLNKLFPNFVKAVLPITPVIGVLSTCILVASAVAQCSTAIIGAGWGLQLPVMLLHLIGGIAGYYIPRALKYNEVVSRTMAIETAMKSSAFGFLLAKLHFSAYDVRVPSAVSVVWMALTGALLAVVWRFIPVTDGSDKLLATK
jgi:bile acid:Na+ symporter, BASS family